MLQWYIWRERVFVLSAFTASPRDYEGRQKNLHNSNKQATYNIPPSSTKRMGKGEGG